jgi:hypothetical protein
MVCNSQGVTGADRVNRVRVFSGETENAGKFSALRSHRTVHNGSPLLETERPNYGKWLALLGIFRDAATG